ncbi:MAG TPA: hypothetical protein VI007_10250 [bacterium]
MSTDADRIARLEQEVRDLRKRLAGADPLPMPVKIHPDELAVLDDRTKMRIHPLLVAGQLEVAADAPPDGFRQWQSSTRHKITVEDLRRMSQREYEALQDQILSGEIIVER